MSDASPTTDEDWTSLPRTGELLLRARHMASTLDDKPHHLMHDLIAEITRLREEVGVAYAHGVTAGADAERKRLEPEIERLLAFVQFVADCSNDPRVVDEAIKMGAKT